MKDMNIETIKSVYFIGAGGIGMSALIRYFLSKGKKDVYKRQAIDSTTNVIPPVKAGEMNEALLVLNDLKVPVQKQFAGQKKKEQVNQYPNFWVGLNSRARCYRKLGMTAKAELDEL